MVALEYSWVILILWQYKKPVRFWWDALCMRQGIFRVAFLAICQMAVDRSALLTDYPQKQGIEIVFVLKH